MKCGNPLKCHRGFDLSQHLFTVLKYRFEVSSLSIPPHQAPPIKVCLPGSLSNIQDLGESEEGNTLKSMTEYSARNTGTEMEWRNSEGAAAQPRPKRDVGFQSLQKPSRVQMTSRLLYQYLNLYQYFDLYQSHTIAFTISLATCSLLHSTLPSPELHNFTFLNP